MEFSNQVQEINNVIAEYQKLIANIELFKSLDSILNDDNVKLLISSAIISSYFSLSMKLDKFLDASGDGFPNVFKED